MKSPFRSKMRRSLAYGLLGVAGEVIFTAVHSATRVEERSAKLEGHSYLWMLPIYGSAAWLFEPLHDRLRHRPVLRRGIAYAIGITGVEFASGMLLKKTVGLIPWDYSEHTRLSVGGAVRLDYLPVWGAAGLLLEQLHDTMA